MGITSIIIGMLFLFNPFINIVDFLPDFLGYIFVIYGSSKLARINFSFATANKYFLWLLYAACAKTAVLFLCTFLGNDAVMLLLMTTVFGTIEAIFGIFAFKNLFEGFSNSALDLAYSKEGNSESYLNEINAICDSILPYTYFFWIARTVLSIMPELASLSTDQYGEVTSDGINNIAGFISIFRTVAFIFALILGIIWIIRITKSLLKIKACEKYTTKLSQKYSSIYLQNEKAILETKAKFFFIFTLAAIILSFRFMVDGINLIPDFLSAILFVISLLFAQNVFGKDRRYTVISILYVISSLAVWFDLTIFANRYHNNEAGSGFADDAAIALMRSFDAIYHFVSICILAFISSVLFFLIVWKITSVAKIIINKYVGEKNASTSSLPLDEKLIKQPLLKQLKLVKITGYLSCLTSFVQIATSFKFPSFYWLIDMPIRLIFVISAFSLFGKLRTEFFKIGI